jgi:flagellar hook-length control protein FliK
MTVASIEQSRANSARPGTDANAAGDPAGLFALLMATLGMPFQMGSNTNGQGETLASPAGSQTTAGDAPSVTGAAEPSGDAPLPNAPAANLPVLNMAPILAGQQPSQTPVNSEHPAPIDFENLLAAAGSAAPNPMPESPPANAAVTASTPKTPGIDTNGPTIAASTLSAPEAIPAAPAFVPTPVNDAHASAPTTGHPITNNPRDIVEREPSESRASPIDTTSLVAANDTDSTDRAPAPTAAERPASSAEPPRPPVLSQPDIAKTVPVPPAPSRNQTMTADRTGDSGSERLTGSRDSAAATVELPSIAVAAIEPTPSSETGPKHADTSGGIAEIALTAPANPVPNGGGLGVEKKDDGIDPIGTRSTDVPAPPRPMAGFEATPLRPETAATPAALVERTALQHVGAHITRAIAEGMDRLTLHLVPAELGRIDITLDVRDDGQVKTTVRADNPTTLDLLQRDSRNLERALESAGLRAESGSLNFSLRNDGRQNQPFSPFQPDETSDGVAVEDGIAALPVSPARSAARGLVDLTI